MEYNTRLDIDFSAHYSELIKLDKIPAKTVVKEMKPKNVKFKLTGGVDGGRGWKGDAKNMLLDITKIKTLGWKPELNTKQAITKAIKHLITELL